MNVARVNTLLVLAALLSALAPGAHAADDVCNVSRRKANLDFTVKDIAGKDVRLSQYQGQVVLLNFWATWCVPCKREIPALTALYRDYKKRGFVVRFGRLGDSRHQAVRARNENELSRADWRRARGSEQGVRAVHRLSDFGAGRTRWEDVRTTHRPRHQGAARAADRRAVVSCVGTLSG
jgi:thiol-disulfide isomerase/thioredoxin